MGQHQSVILEQVHDAYVAQERDFNDQDDKAHHQDENVSGSQRTTKKFDDIEKKERGWMLTKQRGNGTAKPLLPPTSLKAKARRRNDATPESKSLHGQVQALLAAQAAERAAKDQADKMQRRTEDLVDRVKNFISWDEE